MKKYVGSLIVIAGLFGIAAIASAEAVRINADVKGMGKQSMLDVEEKLEDSAGNITVQTLTGVKAPRFTMAFRALDKRDVVNITVKVNDTTTGLSDSVVIRTIVGNGITEERASLSLQ